MAWIKTVRWDKQTLVYTIAPSSLITKAAVRNRAAELSDKEVSIEAAKNLRGTITVRMSGPLVKRYYDTIFEIAPQAIGSGHFIVGKVFTASCPLATAGLVSTLTDQLEKIALSVCK